MKFSITDKELCSFQKYACKQYPYARDIILEASTNEINNQYPKLVNGYAKECLRIFVQDELNFDKWACFNYRGHNPLEYTLNMSRAGLKPYVNPQRMEHIKGNLEDGLKDLKNYFKRLARETHQHILLWIGGEYQPNGMLPHYHTGIKFEKYTPDDDVIVNRWRDYNGWSENNPSAWIEDYDVDKNGLMYQEKAVDNSIWVACPMKKARCRKGRCLKTGNFKINQG